MMFFGKFPRYCKTPEGSVFTEDRQIMDMTVPRCEGDHEDLQLPDPKDSRPRSFEWQPA
jgi:hypothetical protein